MKSIPPSSYPRLSASLRIGAFFTVAALTAACPPVADSAGTAGTDAELTEAEPAEAEPKAPITIAIGGDVHFEGMLRQRLDSDPATALGPISQPLSQADVAMVNLETAVTEGGTPAPGKEFRFRAPATAFDALASAGVDVASVANNHGMDYGADGLRDTLNSAAEADFPLIGAGLNADEAYAPHIVEANGGTVAFIGATDVLDEHLIAEWTAGDDRPGLASAKYEKREHLISAVAKAADQADTVIINLHWGLEGDHCPLPHAPDLARDLISAGADAVVGGHAHVLSPGGYLDDAFVHYGLGNFAFYNSSGPTAETGVLTLTVQDGTVLDDEWLPARIQGGVPVAYTGDAADQAYATWEGHRERCSPELTAEPGEEPGTEPGEPTGEAVEAG